MGIPDNPVFSQRECRQRGLELALALGAARGLFGSSRLHKLSCVFNYSTAINCKGDWVASTQT